MEFQVVPIGKSLVARRIERESWGFEDGGVGPPFYTLMIPELGRLRARTLNAYVKYVTRSSKTESSERQKVRSSEGRSEAEARAVTKLAERVTARVTG